MAFLQLGRKKDAAEDGVLEFASEDTAVAARRPAERHSFAEYLLNQGLSTKDEIDAALMEQSVTKERIGAILVRNGFLSQSVLIDAILAHNSARIATERVNSCRIPVEVLEKKSIIVSAEKADTIYVGTMSDETEIEYLVRTYYPEKKHVHFVAFLPDSLPEFLDRMRRTDSLDEADDNEEIRAEEMLDRLIYGAMKRGASDIHIEPRGQSYSVFYRILGVRRMAHEGPVDEYNTISAQVKDRSRMDLAERRVPQDGGFQIEHSGHFVDLRVATIPTVEGEQVIVRILDPERVNPKLTQLGISRISQWQDGISRSNGLCLICGPTGSGKTTTLNASIRSLARFDKKIYSVEDPTEYRIPFTGQVSVNPQVGLDFPRAIRAFMRADPDVIVLGEVRDADTARNAVKAADTGHLVMATLHTGSIVSSLSRLRDLDVDPYELRYILRAVLVQTLVRVICSGCHGSGQIAGETCRVCGGGGYSSRTVVSECVYFENEEAVDRVLAMADPSSRVSGPMPWPEMIDDAIDRMAEGVTSMDELRRVFGSQADRRVEDRGLNANKFLLRPPLARTDGLT